MNGDIAVLLGGFVGAFLFAAVIYSILKWLIFKRSKTLTSLLLVFAVSTVITILLQGYGMYSYTKPLITHVPFLVLFLLVDIYRLNKRLER